MTLKNSVRSKRGALRAKTEETETGSSWAKKIVWSLLALVIVTKLLVDVADRSTVIDPIAVPSALQQMGLTQDVLTREVYDELYVIKSRFLNTKSEEFNLAAYNSFPDFEVPTTKLSYRTLVQLVQEVLHVSPLHVGGEVVSGVHPGSFALLVRFRGSPSLKALDPIPVEGGAESRIATLFARAFLEEIDPQILAAFMWVRDERPIERALVLAQIEDPRHPSREVWIHDLRGAIYRELNRRDKAKEELQRAIASDRSNEKPHILLAEVLGFENKYDEAQREFQAAKLLNVSSPGLYSAWAAMLMSKGQPHEAEEILNEGIRNCGRCVMGFVSLGRFLGDAQRYSEAAETFREAIAIDPNSPEPHASLGHVLYGIQREEAAAEYERARELSPHNDKLYAQWGDDLRDVGDWYGAAEKYERALNINPCHDVGFDFLNKVAKNPRDLTQEVAAFRGAADPRFGETYLTWAIHLKVNGPSNYPDALAKIEVAKKLTPDSLDVYVQSALVLRELNRASDARMVLYKALRLHPRSFALLSALADTQVELGDLKGALWTDDRALRTSTGKLEKAAVYRSMAVIFFKLRDEKSYRMFIGKAETLDPSKVPDMF